MNKLIFEKGNLGDSLADRPTSSDLISYVSIPIINDADTKTYTYNQFFNKSLLSFPTYYLSAKTLSSSSDAATTKNMHLPDIFNTESSTVQNIVLQSNYALMTLFLYVTYWTYGSIDLEAKRLAFESDSKNVIAVGNSIIDNLWWNTNTNKVFEVTNKIDNKLNINNVPPYSTTNMGYVEGNNKTGRYSFYWSEDSILLNENKLGTYFKSLINKADYYRQGVGRDNAFDGNHPFTLNKKQSLREKLTEQKINLDKIPTWDTSKIFTSGEKNIGHYSTGWRLIHVANQFNDLIDMLITSWADIFQNISNNWEINSETAGSYWNAYRNRLQTLKIEINKNNTISRLKSDDIYSVLKSGIDILYLMVEQSSIDTNKIVIRMPQIFNDAPSSRELIFHNLGYSPSSISPVFLLNIDNTFITEAENIDDLKIKLYNKFGEESIQEVQVKRIGPDGQRYSHFSPKKWFLPYVPVLGVYHTITTENSEETVIDIYDSSLPDTTITSTTQGDET